jgi:hypothetical protein
LLKLFIEKIYICNLLQYYNITIGDLVGPLAVAPEQFTLKGVAGIRAAMLASSANGLGQR